MKRSITAIGALAVLAGTLSIVGCSSSPDAEQLQQLNTLKDEYAALQRDNSSKSDRVASLNRDNAAKSAQLAKCNNDQRIVRQKLGK